MDFNPELADVVNFMRVTSIMTIATVYENKPLASIILFDIEDDGTIYFTSSRSSYKIRALLTNPKISFTVWEHNQMYIQGDGQVSEVTEAAVVDQILSKLAQTSDKLKDFWPPLLHTNSTDYGVFKIKLTWLRAMDLINQKISVSKLPYKEFEFKII